MEPALQWGPTDYLLAHVLDVLRVGNWLTVETNKRKGARNPYPKPIPRPGSDQIEDAEPQPLTGHELVDWLKKVG